MNLVGQMKKFCEAQRAYQKIWLCTNQVHIPMNRTDELFNIAV